MTHSNPCFGFYFFNFLTMSLILKISVFYLLLILFFRLAPWRVFFLTCLYILLWSLVMSVCGNLWVSYLIGIIIIGGLIIIFGYFSVINHDYEREIGPPVLFIFSIFIFYLFIIFLESRNNRVNLINEFLQTFFNYSSNSLSLIFLICYLFIVVIVIIRFCRNKGECLRDYF